MEAGLRGGEFRYHSFRATTATDLLKQNVSPEQVQYRLGHSDARTTDLYNRADKEVTRIVVERISILTVFGSEAGLMAGRFGSSVQRQNSLGHCAT